MAGQAFEGQTFADVSALHYCLQARMLFLCQEYPTSALNGAAPFPPSGLSTSQAFQPCFLLRHRAANSRYATCLRLLAKRTLLPADQFGRRVFSVAINTTLQHAMPNKLLKSPLMAQLAS